MNLISLYKDILDQERDILRKLFSEFSIYLDSVNQFLSRKQIEISSDSEIFFKPNLKLKFEENAIPEVNERGDFTSSTDINTQELPLDQQEKSMASLSSGERQIISLLYAAHISSHEIVLVDEPEISLHTAWQENLLEMFQKQLKGKQIIVCTHSPMIGAGYIDEIQCMNVSNTNEEDWEYAPEIISYNYDLDNAEYSSSQRSSFEEENSDINQEVYPNKLWYEEE